MLRLHLSPHTYNINKLRFHGFFSLHTYTRPFSEFQVTNFLPLSLPFHFVSVCFGLLAVVFGFNFSGGMNEGVSLKLKLKLSLSMVFVEVLLLISSEYLSFIFCYGEWVLVIIAWSVSFLSWVVSRWWFLWGDCNWVFGSLMALYDGFVQMGFLEFISSVVFLPKVLDFVLGDWSYVIWYAILTL